MVDTPDSTTQFGSTYKANIDGSWAGVRDNSNPFPIFATNATFTGTVLFGGAASFGGGTHGIKAAGVVWDMYRPTATPGLAVMRVFSDVGGIETNTLIIAADGDVTNINNSYGAISERRFKKDFDKAKSQWNDVKALAEVSVNFFMKTDKDNLNKMLGLTVEDVEPISPGLISIDPETGDKRIKYSIAYMKNLIASGEMMTRIETLETQIEELKDLVNANNA